MGNNIGARNKAKVMRTNGDTSEFKTPKEAWEIIKCYPGHVLLESEAVKQMGLRARPLSPLEELMPNKIYFLIERPILRKKKAIKRQWSDGLDGPEPSNRPVRVKVRLPKAQLTRLMEESRDEAEVAKKIIELYLGKSIEVDEVAREGIESLLLHQQVGSWWYYF